MAKQPKANATSEVKETKKKKPAKKAAKKPGNKTEKKN